MSARHNNPASMIDALCDAIETLLPEYPRDSVNGTRPTFEQCENARALLREARK